MFGFAACCQGRPGFVNASVRTVTNARQVGMRMQSKCTGTPRHVHVGVNNTSEKMEQTGRNMGTSSCPSNGGTVERGDQRGCKTREQKKKAKVSRRMLGIVHEHNKNKGTNHVQDEMEKLNEQELLSLVQLCTEMRSRLVENDRQCHSSSK